MRTSSPTNHPAARLGLGLAFCVTALPGAWAQGLGVGSLGTTGGLHIPSAYVLGSGEAAASLGNAQDPKLGIFSHRRNYTLGFGLGQGLEIFGRLADYTNPPAPGQIFVSGVRDISANIKWQLPIRAAGIPTLAVGATDLSGGASYFRSAYAVASDEWGPVRWSAGLAHGTARGQAKALDGLFGGAEARLWDTRATALLETDGTRRHVGLRYYSTPLAWLGNAQAIGSVQRSFGASTPQGRNGDATAFNLSLVVPMGADDTTRNQRGLGAAQKTAPLPPLDPLAPPGGRTTAALPDPLPALQSALRSAGLDRIRVGTLGTNLVVEFENHRYLHNEADALGIVLGLGAEFAPSGIRRVHAIALKTGQVVFENSVDVTAFRNYLRDGDAIPALASMGVGRLQGYDDSAVQWLNPTPSPFSRVRISLQPLLNHALATEVGVFDYSLALQARATAPLWQGAEVYADTVQRLHNTANLEPGRIYGGMRHRNGLQTLALQQSFWLGTNVFTSVGAGRYQFDALGAEGESILFMPWNTDTVHLRGSVNHFADRPTSTSNPSRTVDAWSANYRWRMAPTTWAEGGVHAYSDGSTGPSVALTHWFGDTALQLYARKGGSNTFVGLELSLPLAPRQGMGTAAVQLTGAPRFATGVRTLHASGASNNSNYIKFDAVRPVALNYQPEVQMLNSGRITADYMRTQLPRLRESFYLYARALMPT